MIMPRHARSTAVRLVLLLISGWPVEGIWACSPGAQWLDDTSIIQWRGFEVHLMPANDRLIFPEPICGVLNGPRRSLFPWGATGGLYMVVGGQPFLIGNIASEPDRKARLLCARSDRVERVILGISEASAFRWYILDARAGNAVLDMEGGGRSEPVRSCDVAPDGCQVAMLYRSGFMAMIDPGDGKASLMSVGSDAEHVWLHAGCRQLDVLASSEIRRCAWDGHNVTKCRHLHPRIEGELPRRHVDGAFSDFLKK